MTVKVTFGMAVRTLVSRFLFIMLCIILIIPGFFLFLLPERLRFNGPLFTLLHLFYLGTLKVTLLPITFVGKENLPAGPAVYAANHLSSLDIPLVGVLLKSRHHIWTAKEEVKSWRWIGTVIDRVAIMIDMTNPVRALRALSKLITIVQTTDNSVIIFPEGTRVLDGTLHEFYPGFAVLAKKSGRPVVPVMIIGVDKAYPPDTFWVVNYPITVVIGKPFVCGVDESEEDFKNRVYQWFVAQRMAYKVS